MLNLVFAFGWAGSSLWLSLHLMMPYLTDPDLARWPVLLMTAAVYVITLLATWVLGRVVGKGVARLRL